jgi:hypothetical protein
VNLESSAPGTTTITADAGNWSVNWSSVCAHMDKTQPTAFPTRLRVAQARAAPSAMSLKSRTQKYPMGSSAPDLAVEPTQMGIGLLLGGV